MAVPQVIPTSFVPHPSAGGSGRSSLGLAGIFTAAAFVFLVLSIAAAIAVFAYGNLLTSQKASKDAALATAESSLDQGTIAQFIRLRDRLQSAQTLLNNHIALSPVFDLLESVTPQDADFSSVAITVDDTGTANLVADGTAKSFNSLAATSNDFSADARLKNTIFSNIAIAQNGNVSFVLSATLDPKLVAYTGAGDNSNVSAAATPVATSTATTTTP
jgi:hypothetical protein